MLPPSSPSSLFRALKDRKIAQWAVAYLAAAWLVVQVVALIGGQFGWPDALQRAVTVALGMGFFAVLILAWYHGERGQQRVTLLELALLVVVVIAGIGAVVYAARPEASTADESESLLPTAAEHASIAVLPFADMSVARDQEHFSDGMTEELLNALAQIEGLRVAARTSAFAFKGKNEDARTVAQRLGVSKIVEGSVRKSGNRVRITAQLIDATNGYHMWSATYDREVADLIEVQEEIARAIARALEARLQLLDVPSNRLVRAHTTDAEAHDLYLRGRYYWNKRTPEALRQSLASFQHAIQRDSTYALAYAGVADTYMSLFDYGVLPEAEASRDGRAAAQRALQLDSTLAAAHNSLAHAHLHAWRWDDALREFRRAIELDPSYAPAYHWYALALTAIGRTQDAVTVMQRAHRLDPLSIRINVDLGMAFLAAHRYDEAIEQERKTLELEPGIGTPLWITGMSYEQKGMLADAIRYYQLALEKAPTSANYLAALAHAQAKSGQAAEARRILAELESRKGAAAVSPFFIALVYAGLGDVDRGLHWLQRSVEERAGSARYLIIEQRLDPLRADPRYTALMQKTGLNRYAAREPEQQDR
ncbi:MAG TPA: tetratricopeptide repeat protein [Longimicrobiales bacterium]